MVQEAQNLEVNMDLKEIVYRHDSIPLEEEECLFVIRSIIKHRTGKVIEPYIRYSNGLITASMDLDLMMELTKRAIVWYRNFHTWQKE